MRHALAATVAIGLSSVAESAFPRSGPPTEFSIAAQPLAAALDAYSAASGIQLFYDGELAIGRRSSAVKGVLAPDEALRELLIGTDLFARPTGADSRVIGRLGSARVANPAGQSFFALMQARVSQVLCARADTHSGDRDMLLQLWIAPSGRINHVRVLDEADRPVQNNTVAAALQGMAIGAPPSADIKQPITMAILAGGHDTGGCASSAPAMAVH